MTARSDLTVFLRYLAAKRTVDDRALNRRVWRAFRACLAAWGLTEASVHYTLLDVDPANIALARKRLASPPPPHEAP
ncbi:MAG TPA: hypothetical protein G4O04_07395 [Anaerolineae bacterium]|nr:hypothetical protein [Anaerolineae bacterium]HIQ08199.1 hypothetical protein [Anaerolineaceae bacterium]